MGMMIPRKSEFSQQPPTWVFRDSSLLGKEKLIPREDFFPEAFHLFRYKVLALLNIPPWVTVNV